MAVEHNGGLEGANEQTKTEMKNVGCLRSWIYFLFSFSLFFFLSFDQSERIL